MATATAKAGTRNGIEWRTDSKGHKSYRWVLNTRAAGKQRGAWTRSNAEAKSGRAKALGEIEAGTAVRTDGATLRDQAEAFFAGVRTGAIRDRKGNVYKPATIRGYRRGWERIEPELGAHKLSAIRRADVQALVDRLLADGLSPSTVRNTLDPLRSIYRRAIQRDRVAVNPTANLDVPAADNGRERFASREEASALVAALPEEDRTLWAAAFYTGMRSGELRALRWSDVDLAAGVINVQRGWDDNEDEIEPKSKGSKRKVPVVPALDKLLKAHQTLTGRAGSDLVFGRSESEPFYRSTARARALKAWKATDPPLDPIGLHECRHTAASLMIAAGCNAKALSTVMGHASIQITFDRYGKLMPGGEQEVGRLLGDYLDGDS